MKKFILILWISGLYQLSWGLDVPFRGREDNAGFPGDWMISHSASARDLGMGQTGTALRGAASPYHNPAGIINNERGEVIFLIAPLFESSQFHSVSFSYPISKSNTAGFTFLQLTSGEAEKTDTLGQSIGSFKEQDLAFLFSFGHRFFKGLLDTGITTKIIRQAIDGRSDNDIGMDIGTQSRFFDKKITLGFSVLNLKPARLQLREKKEKHLRTLKGGVAYQSKIAKRKFTFTADISSIIPEQGSRFSRWATGFEFEPMAESPLPFVIRGGFNYREYSAGLGLQKGIMSLDYASTFHELEILHRFGFSLKFGYLSSHSKERLDQKWEELKIKEADLKRMEKKIEQQNMVEPIGKKIRRLQSQGQISFANQNYEKTAQIVKLILDLNENDEIGLALETELNEHHTEQLEKAFHEGQHQIVLSLVSKLKQSIREQKQNLYYFEMSRAYLFIEQEKYSDTWNPLNKVKELFPDDKRIKELEERLTLLIEINSEGEAYEK